MDKSLKIGFPEGTLLDQPLRVEVADHKLGLYAIISKPANTLFDSYLGAPKIRSMMDAIRAQKGKPELERLGISAAFSVGQTDFEYSGAAMFSPNRELAAKFRNAMWSGLFEIEYLLFARASDAPENFEVDLPMLMDEQTRVWRVSHKYGKKAKTTFTRLQKYRDYELWKATANSVRPHQIRLHAAEAGLKVLGEKLYARGGAVFLSSLKGDYRLPTGAEKEEPLYKYLAIHASAINMKESPDLKEIGEIHARASLPPKFAVMLKKTGFNLENL